MSGTGNETLEDVIPRRSFARLAEFATDLIGRMHAGEITTEQALTEWRKVRSWEENHIDRGLNRSGALPSPQGNAPQSREAANSGAHRQDADGIGQ